MKMDYEKLLAAELARKDPMTRFVESLPAELRGQAEETMRMRREFESAACRSLTGSRGEAMGAVQWLHDHGHETIHRWTSLRDAAVRWAERDVSSLSFRVPR